MRYFLYVLIPLFILSCTHDMVNDPSTHTDGKAYYESLHIDIDGQVAHKNSVFIFNTADIATKTLSMMGKFQGTYKIRSKDCSYERTDIYSNGAMVELPLSEIMGSPTVDRTCAVFLDVFPDKPPKAEHAVYPIYRTITLIASTKLGNASSSYQIERLGSFVPFEITAPVSTGDKLYQIIRKCSRDEDPTVIGPFSFTGSLIVDAEELQLNNNELGYCYFSILYQADEGTFRYGFAINVYREDFRPLMVFHGVQKKKYKVEPNDYVYSCGIHDEHSIKDKCSRKLKELPEKFLIYAHTNKRSFYQVVTK